MEQESIQQRRLLELLDNPAAKIQFKNDPLFCFISLCAEQNVNALNLINKLAAKKLVLVDAKLTAKVWKSFAETINLFSNKELREIYIQNTELDDEYFPMVLEEMKYRQELQTGRGHQHSQSCNHILAGQ